MGQETAKGSQNARSNETRIAVLGILATLVAAVTGSVTTYLSSSNAIETAAQQSASEFRKDQQRTAYTTLLNEYTKLFLAEEYLVNRLRQARPGVPMPPADFQNEYNGFIAQWTKVRDTAIAVALVQSVDMQKATMPFGNALDGLRDAVEASLGRASSGQLTQSDVDALWEKTRAMEPLRGDVVDAARKDLGFEPTQ